MIKNIKLNKNLDCLVIVGPTAVGKSATAIELANKYNGEIISGDAYQVYKKMDIGTAKVSKEEQEKAVHHLIDIIDYKKEYNVMHFQKEARKKIKEIKAKGKLPIIAGGSGLYIQAVLYDYKFDSVEGFDKLKEENNLLTVAQLQKKIKKDYKVKLNHSDLNNHRRLVVIATKLELGLDINDNGQEPYYDNFQIIGLTNDREKIYDRINKRVDMMIKNGLIDEVKQFEPTYYSQNAIGYKELHMHFAGTYTKKEAIELIKKNSRNFAKRQYTWYNNKMNVSWYELKGESWQLIKN